MLRLAGFLFLAAALAAPSHAAPGQRLIPDYGAYRDIPDAHEKPDPALRYKIVFEVTAAARDATKPHHGLEKVARMVNLLSVHGVDVQPGDMVVAIHGPASRTTLTNAAYAKRHEGAGNPNVELIRQLTAAGVSIRICGQAMMAMGYAKEELNPDVKVDVSAITTVATMQMRGYAVMQD